MGTVFFGRSRVSPYLWGADHSLERRGEGAERKTEIEEEEEYVPVLVQ